METNAPTGPDPSDRISMEELRLAARNHGMPLELLRSPLTPAGLHYVLVHYDIPAVDPAGWRLAVGGRVEHELQLSLDDLLARPRVTTPVTFECAGNGRALLSPRPISQPWLTEAVGTAEWTGTPLRPLLEEAGVLDGAVEVLFAGIDRGVEGGVAQRYERSLSLAEALGDDVLLAYEMNGAPLPPQHGFPLRLVVPGWYGMTNVKWLAEITVLDRPFEGYQQAAAYRMYEAGGVAGEPVTRMMPRALMAPPGVPDFMTRERFVEPGPCRLRGRAWSGWGPIEKVEVSTDGGATWEQAALGEELGPHAWRGWHHDWVAERPGRHELRCRATDAAGNAQPADPPWNLKGYANNAAQAVTVTVTSG
jgi:DMSO/TMAO reductase YedYZ molybdopterin-dependent catalytic subunit